ncbi:hypothetical protein PS683_00926 [Pseudomonas fluorescens]|uniref:Uncharacterized protein n=1 Tax=Pseudomonas fluorescens TaxID=294 RepID=A0A5E6MK73_PSEFL|nr:hypothetical protein PS683_00926 [Pseudomonas fluorescens]VVM53894.1 hypothetical protein PS683_00926 [Pseudomonas fluorescens]
MFFSIEFFLHFIERLVIFHHDHTDNYTDGKAG